MLPPPSRKLRATYWPHLVRFLILNTVCACLGLMLSTKASEPEYGGIVRGKIVRSGEPAANTQVIIEDEFGQQYAPIFTDRAGMFVMTGVKAGNYKVLVGSAGDRPTRTAITVGPALTNVPPIELSGRVEVPHASIVPSATPVSPRSITPDEARAFVKHAMSATEEGNLPKVMAGYAPQVDYYDQGVRDQKFILSDQKNYLSRFTQRKYELGAIDIIKGNATDIFKGEPDTIQVRFSYRYRLSGNIETSGFSSEIWVLRKNEGQIQIIDCKSDVQREKIPESNFTNSLGRMMVWIPSLRIWVCETEVSQSEFASVMDRNPSQNTGSGDLPVDSVTQPEALEFCTRLTKREVLPSRYSYTLPTDAQWSAYVDNANLQDAVTSEDRPRSGPAPVKSLGPNQYGLYDTRGNVWEWTRTKYAPSLNSPEIRAEFPFGVVQSGPRKGEKKGIDPEGLVLRGGSWRSKGDLLKTTTRGSNSPTTRDNTNGFRIVLAPRE